MTGWEVGTDIGGTFTDIVAVHGTTGDTRTAKVPSRLDAPVDAMLAALAAVGLERGDVRRFVHGTTRITNALVQDRLPPVALVATAGFEDVLALGRYRRRELYRLDTPPKAPPLVPPGRCFGLRERVEHTGAVLEPLQDAELDRLEAWLRGQDVAAVAVCLLHSYANPAHEQAVAARLRSFVQHLSLSHEVNPEAREYERASSTAFNAAAMPVAAGYLQELEERLPLGPGLQVFHSAGGMMPVAAARARPIAMAKSGPAAGVAASAALARRLGLPRVLTFDMGGTTTDVCLIENGAPAMTDGGGTADRPLRQPALAVQSIGAGGGSLVRLGPGGLAVGPQSAGAEPGPACYGRGGTLPTVTDANLLLGFLEAGASLGGAITLDPDLAARALQPVADALGVDLPAAAAGVVRVANAAMARALRGVTVERGVDGRDCVLLAFGGGGPMHAAGLAELYGIATVVVPPASGAFSALGCLQADLSFLAQATLRLPLAEVTGLSERLAALGAAAAAPLRGYEGVPAVEYTALMRYEAQSGALPAPLAVPPDPAALHRDFQARHAALYGYATDEPAVIEAVRAEARLPSAVPPLRPVRAPPGPERTRLCHFPGASHVPTVILDRAGFEGVRAGPAIVVDEWSTTVVPPGWRVRAEEDGTLLLDRAP